MSNDLLGAEGDPLRLFEKLCLEGFQAGLSWITILRRRPAFREVFHGFEPAAVAAMTEVDVDRLLGDARIIRHRGKTHFVETGRGQRGTQRGVIVDAQVTAEPDDGYHYRQDSPGPRKSLVRGTETPAPGAAAGPFDLRAEPFGPAGPGRRGLE